MWQKRPKELYYRLRFEKEERTLQMQQTVVSCREGIVHQIYDIVQYILTPYTTAAAAAAVWGGFD